MTASLVLNPFVITADGAVVFYVFICAADAGMMMNQTTVSLTLAAGRD